jgi:hypothetical protein
VRASEVVSSVSEPVDTVEMSRDQSRVAIAGDLVNRTAPVSGESAVIVLALPT